MSKEDTIMIEQAFITLGGKEILHSAAIRSQKGKVTGLLGSNGSGKSTLLKILFGSLKPSDAHISCNGKHLSAQAFATRNLINYLPQHTFLPVNVVMAKLLDLFHISKEELLVYLPELQEDLALTTEELSGGKVRIWQTVLLLLAPTRFTLLDEPFTHLSPLFVERLNTIIKDVAVRKGIILTDHLYKQLLAVTDELWFMKSGQTFLIRHTEDLALHGYIRSLD